MKRGVKLIALTCVVFFLSGCETAKFYSQSVAGHLKLMSLRQSLDEAKLQVTDEQRELLNLVPNILEFASREVLLPDNGSYRSYVPLPQDYPVYMVLAAPEFSTEAVNWCYLIIGCASYRGYFDREAAELYAQRFHETSSADVHVQGAIAYSTLGWFKDPLLPTMLWSGEVGLVELLLHELAHQKLYFDNSTAFNEAFASAVAELGTQRWLEGHLPAHAQAYQQGLVMRAEFDRLIVKHKQELDNLYASTQPEDVKRERKRELINALHTDYQRMKQDQWQGDARYDAWFEAPVNNARLAGFVSYRGLVDNLKVLFSTCDESFNEFYATLESAKPSSLVDEVPSVCLTQ